MPSPQQPRKDDSKETDSDSDTGKLIDFIGSPAPPIVVRYVDAPPRVEAELLRSGKNFEDHVLQRWTHGFVASVERASARHSGGRVVPGMRIEPVDFKKGINLGSVRPAINAFIDAELISVDEVSPSAQRKSFTLTAHGASVVRGPLRSATQVRR